MTPPFDTPCVILCGGKSSRMGEDKALLPFANYSSLVEYQFKRLKPYFKELYLSSKTNKFDFLDDEKALILEESEIYSPMIALQAILSRLKSDRIFILTVDTPFVSIESITKLLCNHSGFDITLAQTKRLHNLCGVFNKSCLPLVEKALAQDIHKIGFIIKQSRHNIIEFEDDNEFLNLNFKEDYELAQELIKSP